MEKELIHKDCGGVITVKMESEGGCNDPECCGGASYHIEVACNKCSKVESIH